MTAVSEQVQIDEIPAEMGPSELVREHQAGVWRYLRFLGADPAEAEDLTQDTFLAAFRSSPQIRSRAETAGYLRIVARNQLLMLRRRQKRQVSTVELESAESVWAELAGTDGSLGSYLAALGDCLEKLEGRARQAVDLQYRVGASRAAIATELEMKPDGVKTLLRRTRQLLRECVERRMKSVE